MDASIRARNAADKGLQLMDPDRLLVHGSSVVAFPAYEDGRRLYGSWYIAVVVALAREARVGEVVFVQSAPGNARDFNFAFSLRGVRAQFAADTPLVPLQGWAGMRRDPATSGLVCLDMPMPDQVTWYAGNMPCDAEELARVPWKPSVLFRARSSAPCSPCSPCSPVCTM